MERFQNLVYTEDSDIVCVNETWLREDTGPDNLEILHSGYTIFRKDRKSRGGGVLLAVKSSSFKSVREIKHNYNIEVTVAELTTASDMKLLVASCYRPPNEDQTWMERFNNFLGGVCSNHANIVLAGDFNLPQISWNSPETTTGVSESTFIELLHDYFLVQLNNTATRGDNILDLVITNIPDLVKVCDVWSPAEAEIFTDHNVINFELLFHPKRAPKIQRTVYDYRRGDFTALRSALESLNLSATISADSDINDDWRNWRNTFVDTVSHHIPSTKIRGRNYVPWMNSDILHNIKKKSSLRHKLKKSKTPKSILKQKSRNLELLSKKCCVIVAQGI
jgi:hypothetical protein